MIQNHRQTQKKFYILHIWRMKDAYTCEHPVRMTEADSVCGWRVRMTCAHTCEHRLTVQFKTTKWSLYVSIMEVIFRKSVNQEQNVYYAGIFKKLDLKRY